MMNSAMTSACFGVLLVGASARAIVGEYGGYGDELGMYGEYGAYGAYGEMFGEYDDGMMPSGSTPSEDTPSNTCGAECEMGDDVDDDGADEVDDFDEEPAPAPIIPPTPRSPPVNPVPVPNPTTQTNSPTPSVPTPPTGSTPDVDAETTRATPPVAPVEENAAVALSGSSIMFALIALAAGGAMLM